jgi:hypothetical protein
VNTCLRPPRTASRWRLILTRVSLVSGSRSLWSEQSRASQNASVAPSQRRVLKTSGEWASGCRPAEAGERGARKAERVVQEVGSGDHRSARSGEVLRRFHGRWFSTRWTSSRRFARGGAPHKDLISQLLAQGYRDSEVLTERVTFGAAGVSFRNTSPVRVSR